MPSHYPSSISDIDLDGVTPLPEVVAAVLRLVAAKPYKGSLAQRQAKFRRTIADICEASGVRQPQVAFRTDEGLSSGLSFYRPRSHLIVLVGSLSVITCLHEVAHAIFGPSEHVACAWSLRLFRDCFPKSWSRLRFDGHVAVKPGGRRSRSLDSDNERR